MSRQVIRSWKRSMRIGARADFESAEAAIARDCALALLQRSISFGHGRLAVLRLVSAVRSGAAVPPVCWDYCRTAVSASRDLELQSLYAEATERAAAMPSLVVEKRDAEHPQSHKDMTS
jgi:hypothetical protein